MCNVILTVYNNPELTQKCLESLKFHNQGIDELVIVDNGSDPETRDLIAQFCAANTVLKTKILRLEPNQGFVKAVNAGIQYSADKDVCLLSNDTLVTSGWLSEMLNVCAENPDIGIAGPSSNNYGIKPKKGTDPDCFAHELIKYKGQFQETHYCVGFCMLIKREVVQKIGYLDEIFSPGYFEDNDYCRRACAAGFRNVIVKASYVWHREHSTFSSEERERQFARNRGVFISRWGEPERIMAAAKSMDNLFAEKIINMARTGNWVTVVCSGLAEDVSVKLCSHAAVKIIRMPAFITAAYAYFLFFKKTKKRYARLIVNNKFSKITRCFGGFIFPKKYQEL